jgi:hypothetical protein
VATSVATIILRAARRFLRTFLVSAIFVSAMSNFRAGLTSLRAGSEALPYPKQARGFSDSLRRGKPRLYTGFSAACDAVPYPEPIHETNFRQCLLHSQVGQNLGIFFPRC